MKVFWSPRARLRVSKIAGFIAQDDPEAAGRWVEQVFAKAEQIPPFPKRGVHVPETERDDIRQVFLGEYRLIYRFDELEVLVLSVRHGAQLPDEGLV